MERLSQIIELPSQGYLYEDKLPGGEIEIYAMGVQEEALLINKQSRSEAANALDRLIERCIKTDFPIDDLLISDKFYILLMIRSISLSDQYTYQITCPECGDKFQYTVRIPGSFTVTLLDEGVKEPFYVDLPVVKKRVGFRLLRVSDEKASRLYVRNQNRLKRQEIDPGYIYRLAKHIISIDNIPEDTESVLSNPTPVSVNESLEFIKNLISKDSLAFKNEIANKDCGINIRLDIECNQCGETFKDSLEFKTEFFRPESE